MTAKNDLRILLLGTPLIQANGQPLQIQRRLLRWMLFFLACQEDMVGRADRSSCSGQTPPKRMVAVTCARC